MKINLWKMYIYILTRLVNKKQQYQFVQGAQYPIVYHTIHYVFISDFPVMSDFISLYPEHLLYSAKTVSCNIQ